MFFFLFFFFSSQSLLLPLPGNREKADHLWWWSSLSLAHLPYQAAPKPCLGPMLTVLEDQRKGWEEKEKAKKCTRQLSLCHLLMESFPHSESCRGHSSVAWTSGTFSIESGRTSQSDTIVLDSTCLKTRTLSHSSLQPDSLAQHLAWSRHWRNYGWMIWMNAIIKQKAFLE